MCGKKTRMGTLLDIGFCSLLISHTMKCCFSFVQEVQSCSWVFNLCKYWWLWPFPRQPGFILNPCPNSYINFCSCTPLSVILISVLYYAHPESSLWNRIRALVEVISQFSACICSIDLQYVNSCNAGLAYGPSASLEARPAWCLITERLSRVLSVN